MGGGKGGGGGSASAETSLTKAQANIANTLFGESGPYRQYLESGIGEALGMFPKGSAYDQQAATAYMNANPGVGDTPEAAWTQWMQAGRNEPGRVAYNNPQDQSYGVFGPSASERQAIESQFNQGARNIQSSGVQGSALDKALTNLNIGRAADIGGLESAAKQNALGLGASLAFNTPTQAAGILGSAQGQQSYMAALQQQQAMYNNQQQQNLGASIGKGAAMALPKFMRCWVAASLYGWGRKDFYLARYAIFTLWKGRLARVVQRYYVNHGPSFALFLNAHPRFKPLVKPLFDFAVAKGRGRLCQQAL